MSVRSDSALARVRRLKRDLPHAKVARKSGPRRPLHRIGGAWRTVAMLLLLLLFIGIGRFTIGQRLDLSGQAERVLRAQIGPQLEKALGAKVEFGEVETDWLGRIIVRDVLIGRDQKLPTGALLRVKSLTLNLDLPGLALGRTAFPGAIRAVEIQNPEIYLRRDARGLNWAKMLDRGGGAKSAGWSGRVSVVDGRVYYLDSTIRNAQKQALLLDARGVDATLDALQNAPYRFVARAKTPLLGAQKLLLPSIASEGALQNDTKNGLFTLETGAAPFAPLVSYAFPRGEIRAREGSGGTLGGRVVFTLTNGALNQHGALSLRNLAFSARALKVPGTSRALEIEALSGPVEFAGLAFSTSGARFSALGTSVQVAGAASLDGDLPFDFDLATPALPLAAMRPFFPRGLSFSSRAAPLRAHFSGLAGGKKRRIEARGTFDAPGARAVSGPNQASTAMENLRTAFAFSTDLQPDNSLANWKIAARGTSPDAKIALESGAFSARNAAFNLRAAQGGGVEIGFDARAFRAFSPRYGDSSGGNLQLTASAPNALRPEWRGAIRVDDAQTGSLKLAAISPDLARTIRGSGALDLNAQFAGLSPNFDLKKARGAATFALSSLQLNERAFASEGVPLRRADFSLSALRGRVALAGNRLDLSRASAISSFGLLRLDASVPLKAPQAARIALSLPQASVDPALLRAVLRPQNVDLGGDWRGRVTLLSRAATSANATPRYGLDLDLRAPSSRLRGVGKGAGELLLNAPRLQARGEFGAASSWNGTGTLLAQNASFRGGKLGELAAIPFEMTGGRAQNLRLDFAAQSGSAQSGSAQSGSAQSGSAQSGSAQSGSAQSGSAQSGSAQSGSAQSGSAQSGSAQSGSAQSGSAQSGSAQSGSAQSGSAQSGSAQSGSAQSGSAQSGSAQSGSAQSGSAQSGSAQSGSAQSGSAQSGSAQSGGSLNRARLSAGNLTLPLAPTVALPGGTLISLQNLSANVESGRTGLRIPRFAARFGGGEVRGTASLGLGGGAARFLASGVDVARLQQLFSPQSRRAAQLSGRASALVEVRPGEAPRAQVRLAGGAVRLVSGARATLVSLQSARAILSVESGGELAIRDALVWSDGARIAGDAALRGAVWSGDLEVSGANLAKFAALPMAPVLPPNARPQGLAGGRIGFAFDTRTARFSRLSGRARLRLAEVFGAQIESLGAQVSLRQAGAGAPSVVLADLSGEIEGAPVAGDLSADFAKGTWDAKVRFSGVKSARLARLQALQNGVNSSDSNADSAVSRTLPIRGEFGGQLQLTGTLRDGGGDFAPRARDGFVSLKSGELAWNGRNLGALSADLSLKDGIVRAETLQLAPLVAGASGAPTVQVTGALPLDLGAAGLDARLRIAPLPLGFFTDALAQGREALRTSGVEIPFFERAVSYIDALPAGTTGQVALDANLSGSWSAPQVQVSSLTLREGRTRLPTGGFSPPATLDAAFTFNGGAVTVERAEFKIKKTARAPLLGAALGVSAPDAEEEDDTLLRIEPGGTARPDGPISLAADVFNANLSQLSPWVPALRTRDGAPLLRGELSEFSFRVGGTTLDPEIIGSIQGENLALESYTLDRLRVARFEIAQGAIRIEAGNLTVVKGAFQSSAPFGSVPWDWRLPGPVMDGPIDVHFPLQTRDFGALVGAFVPALSVADADEFAGSVDVSGTLRSPSLSGAITLRGGQFRLQNERDPLAAGLREVSGTVRFVGATQILIDAADPLRGQLVSASSVVGRAARRADTTGVVSTSGAAGSRSGNQASNANGSGANAGAAAKSASLRPDIAPKLAGEFVLRGSVVRPAQIDALLDTPSAARAGGALSREERRAGAERLRALLDPAAALSRLKYDLSLELKRGAFASDGFGGVSDISAGLIWKTGDDDARGEAGAQNVRWMIAARGQRARKLKSGGELVSFGALALKRDFAAGINALARSGARDFSGESDFNAFDVAKRVDVAKAPDRRAQVNFKGFAASLTGAGNGVVDGRLVLDNGASQQKPPAGAVRLQNASSTQIRSRFGAGWSRDFEADFALAPRLSEIQDELPADEDLPDEVPAEDGAPLRLGGVLTLSSAEIYGAPAGGEGAALLLSRLPGAPRFDVRLKMGRDVQVVTAAFRSGLEGELVAKGSPNDPQIAGILNTRGGQVRFPNARARVDEGRVTIALTRNAETDSLRTRLDIDATARGQAGRYAITLRLRGPLDLSGLQNSQSLQIEVTSNPPLSQSEAFQQLLGTVPDLDYDAKTGLYRTGSVNRAYTNAVLNVISAPLFSGVEQTLAQTLGLTSVGLEYRFSEPLAVQVTKAVGDRVFVSYRRSLGSGPTGSLASGLSSGRTPFELRIDYRLRGSYLIGLQTDERQIPSVTLQKTRRF